MRDAQARARLQEPVQVRDGGGPGAEREPPQGSVRREAEQQHRVPVQPRVHRQPAVSTVRPQGEHFLLHPLPPCPHAPGQSVDNVTENGAFQSGAKRYSLKEL